AVARVAALLHLADTDDDGEPVPLVAVERASRIGHYLLDHASVAFGEMGADPVVALARRSLEHIRRHQLTTLSPRDLYTPLAVRRGQIEPALSLLEERGYLREVTTLRPPEPKRAGRPKGQRYDVNPAALSS